jgi:molybdate transport system substrate-binding protein
MARLIPICLVLSLALAACAAPGKVGRLGRRDRPLLVSAAVSLAGAMDMLAADYLRRTGTAVELNMAASTVLAAQIIAGAPVDVFISADLFQLDRVAAEGLIRSVTRVDLISNQLVVIVPVDAAGAVSSSSPAAALLKPKLGRIAIGDPDGVPVGVYARAYLESVGLWDALQDRVVPVRSARSALAVVETGGVDAGIVYRTDAMSSAGVRVVFEVPVEEGPAIAYPAALTTQAKNPKAAERLLAYLQGPDARAVFEQAGFIVPEARP